RGEHVAKLLDDCAGTAIGDALRRLHGARAGANVHGEHLVHRVELETYPLASLCDAALEPTTLSRAAEDDAADGESERREGRVDHEHADDGTSGTEREDLDRESGAVVVGCDVGEA